MRKLILIAAMSLLASQAYAGGPRSLSLAATNASPQDRRTGNDSSSAATSSGGSAHECPDGDHRPNFNAPGSDCHDNRDRSGRNPAQRRADCERKRNGQAETSPAIHRGTVIRELHRHGICS